MGLAKKSDGRYVVGKGIEDGNEYKGSAAWRDMVIQYSDDGATDKSLEYLTYLKDYALYHSALGDPCIPPNVQIWMSTANTMKAVEADDITVDGETVKIGSCTWDGSDWSFAEPTPGGGGSSLPAYTASDIGKVLTVSEDAEHPTLQTLIEEQSATLANSGMVWVAPLTVLNSAYFENAEVGDKCFITLDSESETESTAIDVYGYALFPVSTFYVGYASLFGGIGIASLSEPSEKTHTVEVKANAPSAVVNWTQGKDVVVLPSANEVGTYVLNTLSTIKASATTLGEPSFVDIDASVTASDNDVFDNMFNIFVNAFKNNKMIFFNRCFATGVTAASNGSDINDIEATFVEPFYNLGTGSEVYNVTYRLRMWYWSGERHYGIYSCITLIKS